MENLLIRTSEVTAANTVPPAMAHALGEVVSQGIVASEAAVAGGGRPPIDSNTLKAMFGSAI